MKNSIYIIVFVLSTFMIVACNKAIEIEPKFELDGSQPLSTLEEAENVLTGAYKGFQNIEYYDASGPIGAFSTVPDMMSDDLIETRESLGNSRALAEWNYVPNDGTINGAWLNGYNIISTVNILLRDIDNLSEEDEEEAAKLKGQALAIRAFVHFDLLRYFAPEYDRNSTQLAVPYVKTFDVTLKPARNTVKECYDNILSDLSTAATLLNGITGINTAASKSRIDFYGVKAIQARVNLYAGVWQDAVNATNDVIGGRALSSIAGFPSIWNDEPNTELVWAISFSKVADGLPYDFVYYPRLNRSNYKPAAELTALYNQVNDIRYNSYFRVIGDFNGRPSAPRQVVAKHIGGSNNGVVNWKVFRTAEMYLIRAEANYRLNKEADARTDLNRLRSSRITGSVPGTETGTALLNAIRVEKRKELFAEGHRFFELKRAGKNPINRCASNTNSPSTICSLSSTSRAWAWPIPFNEMVANTNMIQNTGY